MTSDDLAGFAYRVPIIVKLLDHRMPQNQFERFRGFLEIISRFEFDFLRRDFFFFNDSNFWCVQSSITNNVAVHVPVLWPVCAHTIPIRMLWCL